MAAGPATTRKLAAEFVGTFIFVLLGAGSALAAGSLGLSDPASLLLVAALANGGGLALAVSATMAISGGSMNPAISLSLLIDGKLDAGEFLLYIVAEIAGAIAAGGALLASFPWAIGDAVHWGSPALSTLSVWQGAAVEFLLTFVLATVVFLTAVDSRAPKIAGLGIGLAVVVDVLVGGPYTGAAMNPARAMGPMVAAVLAGQPFPSYWYIYWVGPLLGAVVAALVYRVALRQSD